MTNVNKTNRFFNKNVYDNLNSFALSPISWAFETSDRGPLPDIGRLFLATFCAPILIPATIATMAIALCLTAVTALIHGLSLLVAGIADCFSNNNDELLSAAFRAI